MTKLSYKRSRPNPSPVTVIRPDGDRRVVAAGQIEAEVQLRQWTETRDMLDEQRLYALKEGDTITLTGDTTQVWWFTHHVNGPERTVSARTLILDQRREADLPFAQIEPYQPQNLNEESEANYFRRRLGLATKAIVLEDGEQEAQLADGMPRRFRELLALPESPWHRHDCECSRCYADRHQHRQAA